MPEKNDKNTTMVSPLRRFALKLFVSMLSYILFGLIAFVFLLNYFPETPWLAASALVLILLISTCVLYTHAWHFGHRDRNLVKYGHMAYQKYRGLIAGACASVPFLIAGIALFIYAGPRVQFFYFTVFLPMSAASGAGYIAGHKLFSIGGKLIYKSPKKNDKRLR